ncbi:hypothetical protein HUU40_16110 [candidate division KSB1 bacterium]|nr:hypothetical protein [candidate division KSB1 bacterium]
MKLVKFGLVLAAFFICVSTVSAQSRRNQIEFYGGAAFPLSPKEFKEYTNVGLSGNVQYVLFPSPRLGVTFNVGYEGFSTNNEKFADWLSTSFTGETVDYWVSTGLFNNPTAEIKSNVARIGAGIRPYLTAPEANTQFFLLGQANYNIIANDFTASEIPFIDQDTGDIFSLTFDDKQYEEAIEDNDENVFGVGLGAGLEIPAGSSLNIVVQGLFNIVFTNDESTSFVGVTAGLVF